MSLLDIGIPLPLSLIHIFKPMADLGFFGASLQGYGCAGMGNVEYGLMTQELSLIHI